MAKITSAFDLDESSPANQNAGNDSSINDSLENIDKTVKDILKEISAETDLNSKTPKVDEGETQDKEDGPKGLEKVIEFFKNLLSERGNEKKDEEGEVEEDKSPLKGLMDNLNNWATKLEEILTKTESAGKQGSVQETSVPETKTSNPENIKVLPENKATQSQVPTQTQAQIPAQAPTQAPTQIPASPVPAKMPEMPSVVSGGASGGVSGILSAVGKEKGGDTRNQDIYVADKHGTDPSKEATHIQNPTNAPIHVLSNEYIKNITEIKEVNSALKELPRFYQGTINNISSPETYIQNMSLGEPSRGGLLDPIKNANSPVQETLARYFSGTSNVDNTQNTQHNNQQNTQNTQQSTQQNTQQNTTHNTHAINNINSGEGKTSTHHTEHTDKSSDILKSVSSIENISRYVEGTYKELNNNSNTLTNLTNNILENSSIKELSRYYDGTSSEKSTKESIKESATHKDSQQVNNTKESSSSNTSTDSTKESSSSSIFDSKTLTNYLKDNVINNIEKSMKEVNSSVNTSDISRYFEGTKDSVSTNSQEINNPTNITNAQSYINTFNSGSATTESMFIVGDSKDVDPRSPQDTTSEVILNPTNAPIVVKNNRDSKRFLDDFVNLPKKFSDGTEGESVLGKLPIGDLGKAATFTAAAGTGGSAKDFASGALDTITTVSSAFGTQVQMITSVFASLGKVLVDVVQGFNALAERVAPFSPEITQAKANLQMKEIDFSQNVASKSGGDLGRLYEASGEVWLDIQSMLYEISRPFLSILVPAVETMRDIIKSVASFIEMLSGTFMSLGHLLNSFYTWDFSKASLDFITDFMAAIDRWWKKKGSDEVVNDERQYTNVAIAISGLT